jgi:sulfate/thiosulfate transport system ATP-binding protein
MAIEVLDVSKRFGTFEALHDVSVTVTDGALTALLGPSGSGKSTLLRVIAGLEAPDSGTVRIGGQEMTDAPARNRGVGFVFQHYAPFKHMTVRNNIAFGLSVRKRPKTEIDERVAELLELVRLDGLAGRYPSQLSGGQLQRMALARALAVRPKVLLLDEPFGALDAQVRAELREWLRKLHDEIHVTTIFVTHDQEEAMEVAEQIVVMNAGRIEQTGSPRELYEHPTSEFVMSFIGPVNRIGNAYLRPHDVQIVPEPGGNTTEALVKRVVHLGFEVRVELTLPDGREISAQVTRVAAHELEIAEGQILTVRLPAPRVFTPEPEPLAPEPEPLAPASPAP